MGGGAERIAHIVQTVEESDEAPSLGQGGADLEAPGLAPFPATLARGTTPFPPAGG